MTEAIDQGKKVVQAESDHTVAFKYSALRKTLEESIDLKPEEADETLGNLTLQDLSKPKANTKTSRLLYDKLNITENDPLPAIKPSWFENFFKKDKAKLNNNDNPNGQPTKKLHAPKLNNNWVESGFVYRLTRGTHPVGIAINQDNGDLVYTSKFKKVTILSRNDNKSTVVEDSEPAMSLDVAFSTETKEFILIGKSKFSRHDCKGALVHTHKLDDTPDSVGVDSTGDIILAFGNKKTVCTYDKYGKKSDRFTTMNKPCRLTCALVDGNDKLIVSFQADDKQNKLRIMNKDGTDSECIEPPPDTDIEVWKPSYVCCNQDNQLFVSNLSDYNRKVFVYEYRDKRYKCKSLIELDFVPWGLAWYEKDSTLFIVAYNTNEIFSYLPKQS